MIEYIRSKIEKSTTGRAIKITQPVLVQSQQDKFDIPNGAPPITPAKTGTTLTKQPEEEALMPKKYTTY